MTAPELPAAAPEDGADWLILADFAGRLDDHGLAVDPEGVGVDRRLPADPQDGPACAEPGVRELAGLALGLAIWSLQQAAARLAGGKGHPYP